MSVSKFSQALSDYFKDKYRGKILDAYGDYVSQNVEFFMDLFDSLATPVFCKDLEGVYLYCNEAMAEFLNTTRDVIIGKSIYDIEGLMSPELHHRKDMEVLHGSGVVQYEAQLEISHLSRYVVFSKSPFFDGNNNVVGIVGVISDITENKTYEKKLSRMNGLKDAMLTLSSTLLKEKEPFVAFNTIVNLYASLRKEVAYGYFMKLVDETLHMRAKTQNVDSVRYADHVAYDESVFKSLLLASGGAPFVIHPDQMEQAFSPERRLSHHPKRTAGLQCAIVVPIELDGILYGLFCFDTEQSCVFDDIDLEFMTYVKSQMEAYIIHNRMYNEILNISRYDKLTNIFNRRYFEEHFDVILSRAKRYREHFCMAIFDMNGLKATNDKLGHLAGDYVIKGFVDVVSDSIRTSDIFARFGGDEFIGIFFDTGTEDLTQRFELILEKLKASRSEYKGHKLDISFSYGIASYPDDGESYEALFNEADERMYTFKHGLKKPKQSKME